MDQQAYVSVVLSDNEAIGALVLAKSIRGTDQSRKICCLLDGVSANLTEALRATFDCVKAIQSNLDNDTRSLIASRPDLQHSLYKLQCWRLDFSKCVYVDPACLVLQGADELFDRNELSASSDTKWPDHFNVGVFVFCPSEDTYRRLVEQAKSPSLVDVSFQGILNAHFSSWATHDIQKHLPFTFSVTPNVFYTYQPAIRSFKDEVRIVHFDMEPKPWNSTYDVNRDCVENVAGEQQQFYRKWWQTFNSHVKSVVEAADMQCVKVSERIQLIPYEQAHMQPAHESETSGSPDRQAWETGKIDYLGKDSFDNIQKMLDKSINE